MALASSCYPPYSFTSFPDFPPPSNSSRMEPRSLPYDLSALFYGSDRRIRSRSSRSVAPNLFFLLFRIHRRKSGRIYVLSCLFLPFYPSLCTSLAIPPIPPKLSLEPPYNDSDLPLLREIENRLYILFHPISYIHPTGNVYEAKTDYQTHHLRIIYLSINIDTMDLRTLAKIGQFQYLDQLVLSYTSGPAFLPKSFQNLTQLQKLSLHRPPLISLLAFLGRFYYLTKFSCRIDAMAQLPRVFTDLPPTTTLFFDKSSTSDHVFHMLLRTPLEILYQLAQQWSPRLLKDLARSCRGKMGFPHTYYELHWFTPSFKLFRSQYSSISYLIPRIFADSLDPSLYSLIVEQSPGDLKKYLLARLSPSHPLYSLLEASLRVDRTSSLPLHL